MAVKVLHPAVATVFACDLALMHVGVTLLECLPGMRWLALSDSLTQFSQTYDPLIFVIATLILKHARSARLAK